MLSLQKSQCTGNMLYVDGQLKLCDFGLSRHMSANTKLTANVVSLWYRAPELLLQQNYTSYTFGIDLWAVGCVLGEVLQGYPLLDGRDEMDQISKMTDCLGLPPKRLYSSARRLVSPSNAHNDLWDRFTNLPTESLTLLTKLLEYDPQQRYTAQEALDCDYFTSKPPPAKEMPRFERRETKGR
jgi:serine/threonine protein kinase